jgi:hypothetical protein
VGPRYWSARARPTTGSPINMSKKYTGERFGEGGGVELYNFEIVESGDSKHFLFRLYHRQTWAELGQAQFKLRLAMPAT